MSLTTSVFKKINVKYNLQHRFFKKSMLNVTYNIGFFTTDVKCYLQHQFIKKSMLFTISVFLKADVKNC